MSRHVWPLVKYSKLDPDPTDSMRWAFVSDTSLQVLIEENDSTILKVQVRHPEIIALEQLDLNPLNIQRVKLSLYSKGVTLYGKYSNPETEPRKFQLRFSSMLDLDSLVRVLQRWVIVRDLTNVDSQRQSFSQRNPFDTSAIFSQYQQEALNVTPRIETPPDNDALPDVMIIEEPVNSDTQGAIPENAHSVVGSSCEIMQLETLSSSLNVTSTFCDPNFQMIPEVQTYPLTQSPVREVPVNSTAMTTLPRIMNIEDISDEVLKARYQSRLSIIPEFHWMRAKIQSDEVLKARYQSILKTYPMKS